MSNKQKLVLAIVLLAIAAIILTFTYYEPRKDGVKLPPPPAPLSIEEFIAQNETFSVTQNQGIISIVSRSNSVKIIDTKTILGEGWIFPQSLLAKGVVLSDDRKTIYFALAKTGFDKDKGYLAQSRIYRLGLKDNPKPEIFVSSPKMHAYYWEPVEWTENDTLLVGTYDVELGGGSEGTLEFDQKGNLLNRVPPGPSFEGI